MPYIPHTPSDVELMLEAIGVDDIEALFDEIPGELSEDRSNALSSGLSELEMIVLVADKYTGLSASAYRTLPDLLDLFDLTAINIASARPLAPS